MGCSVLGLAAPSADAGGPAQLDSHRVSVCAAEIEVDLDAAPAAAAVEDTQAAGPAADAQPADGSGDPTSASSEQEAPKRRRRTVARRPAAEALAVRQQNNAARVGRRRDVFSLNHLPCMMQAACELFVLLQHAQR